MKFARLVIIGAGLISGYAAAAQLNTEQDKISYAIGADIGTNFKTQGVQINTDLLNEGIKDALAGKQLQMTKQEMDTTMQNFQKELLAKRQAEVVKIAEQNKQEGEAFLAKNKANQGVVTLPSGLQYKVIQAGTGPKPSDKDTVTVEYTGHLINGKVFDSSEEHGGKVTFQVDQVIPGWQEALKIMPVGSVWEIYVPSKLAYGERGAGRLIGPNETLIFKLRLIGINKPAEKKPA